ncbi:hypothetical protein B0A48_04584 [Cryoendolithus antarcticus]|uniref:Glucose-methanol-choline oxidoreductase N-terminal domain-containing protein n=1 Tax=Cryoendolithus antarcticus TaxID=1507870 RepID=A0A1V8TFR9_9PEZI|nr:hypothetical protein B0A48_04584 [Cryoendolithus antarcticus]
MGNANETNGQTNGNSNGHTNGHGSTLPALAQDASSFLQHDYDFVIIGGGTAGLALAARLTEDSNVTVGVLEAGKNKLGDFLVDTPALYPQMLGNEEYDWKFMTEPQKHNNGKCHHIPRGKALGGSSAINYEMSSTDVRGSTQDFDDWAIILDDPAWSGENMQRYMRKHQGLEKPAQAVSDRKATPTIDINHGTEGPVRTSFNDFFLPIEDDVIAAANEVTGLSEHPKDAWSGDHIGFFNTLGSVCRSGPNKGKRSYAARGYFEANAGRPNLHVLCEALVDNIELEGKKAVGVSFHHTGQSHSVKVKKEVLLCAGTIQSPQVLEMSGIGAREVLEAAGVQCKVELPGVGENYNDHVLTALGWDLAPGVHSLEMIYDPQAMEGAMKQLTEQQGGPLSCISSTQGFFPYKLFATPDEQAEIVSSIEKGLPSLSPFQRKQYERTLDHLKSDKSANLQFVLVAHSANWDGGVEDQSKLFQPPAPGKGFGVLGAICLEYPLSRGSVHIKSSDPTEHPRLDPGFLSHPADAAVLGAGVKFLDKMGKSKHLEGKFARRQAPHDTMDLTDTRQAIKVAQDLVFSEYHPIGSCAMGEVVDSKLKVKGVEGLRVVDASVFPNHVSGNICSSVYATAEHAADIIKADWK